MRSPATEQAGGGRECTRGGGAPRRGRGSLRVPEEAEEEEAEEEEEEEPAAAHIAPRAGTRVTEGGARRAAHIAHCTEGLRVRRARAGETRPDA
jgi:hypothetical protein